ncbi:DNA cytosine methyltransferase [Stutzerimonas kunmingensis]|uniref:DNA cytosine methyltransferase n=1 Tax=Stutzerimonas kunmingensis TaxID=1211807 RepID=UPI0039F61FA2
MCSGIEAASCAWHPLGWRAAFVSEIEPFPSAVLAHHYPDAPNRGDMTRFQEWPDAAIDVLVGGTPCQSFSVAGLRKGLADPRGNLALVYLALADRYRPEWLVWENVPGVLSSNGGRDFGAFLGGLGELGYGFAYRVLDAQYFGVAQRRRRVFVVANARSWRRAAAVLFERHSLSGHPAPRREAREGVATRAGGGAAERGWPAEVAATLNAAFGDKQGLEDQHALSGTSLFVSGDAYSVRTANTSSNGWGVQREVTHTLDQAQGLAVAFDTTQITSAANYSSPKPGDPCHPLAAGAHAPAIASSMSVRRLTPRECERLQGFPDDYTLIPWRNRAADECPDGPRYKALGNSMAVPVMAWIGRRIAQVAAQLENAA